MNGTNTTVKQPEKKAKRGSFRVGALDVLILLLIVAAVAAFFLRGRIQRLFAEEGTSVVTYTFRVTDVEPATAASMRPNVLLYSEDGMPMGEVLVCTSEIATDERALPNGQMVKVRNGLQLLSGTVTATGYEVDGFVYLNGGVLLVPGETVYVSTVDAFFALQITGVTVSDS